MSVSSEVSAGRCLDVEPPDLRRFKRVEVNALHQPIPGSDVSGKQRILPPTA